MSERSISSRPSLEQVVAIVGFMEQHRALALGKLKGLEGRDESKKLWFKLTRIVNSIEGPTRPMKSWIKYWADKKSTVRSKVVSGGGDPNILGSNIEKKIWDLFLVSNEGTSSKPGLKRNKPGSRSNSVKLEPPFTEEPVFDDDDLDQGHDEPALGFDEPELDFDERQMVVMEKLVKLMSEQANAMTQLGHASQVNAGAMERLADAAQIQARAIERLAGTFESIGAATHDVRNALVDIDATMKRFYSTAPT